MKKQFGGHPGGSTGTAIPSVRPTKPRINLKPCGDRLIIERDESLNTTPGGIVVPDTSQEKPRKGTVLAVGPGPRLASGERAAMDFQPGQKVLFTPYAESTIIDDIELVVAKEQDVIAIIGE